MVSVEVEVESTVVPGAVLVKTLFAGTPYLDRPIAGIDLLGTGAVKWQQTARGLAVTLPADTSGGATKENSAAVRRHQ